MAGCQMSLKVHNPTGAVDTSMVHAPRLDTLAGKTVCELSNAQWGYERIFPAVRSLLQEQFPTVKILPYTEVLSSRPDMRNPELVSRIVREKRCQAVIIGMAG